MAMMGWCDICCKKGFCYLYKNGNHPPHNEDRIAPLRSDRDWERIAELCDSIGG